MYEHDEPSKGFSVVNLSSEDEDEDLDALDTSRDEDIVHKLFGNLNRDLLGTPGDGNVIVINDSKEEKVCQDDYTNADVVPPSPRVSPAPSASATDDDSTPDGVKDDSSGGVQNDSSDNEDGAGTP
jgi:hypothetical protein